MMHRVMGYFTTVRRSMRAVDGTAGLAVLLASRRGVLWGLR
jgi:hypothetical protein